MFKWLRDLFSIDRNTSLSQPIDVDPFTTEGRLFTLNIQNAIQAHLNWKIRLRDYISGTSEEELEVPMISSDCNCALGKWIYAEGKEKFGHLPIYDDLRIKHANFHLNAGQVLQMAKDGDRIGAQRQLNGSYSDCSQEVIEALEVLETEARKSKRFGFN